MTNQSLYYTGVGARVTPPAIQKLMTQIAHELKKKDFILRSGGQFKGADQAFYDGTRPQQRQIFYPRHWVTYSKGLPTIDKAYEIAERHHPYWRELSLEVKNLMARNVHAVLGPNLDNPSEFLICWTKDGCFKKEMRTKETGGTGHTISVADEAGVPIFNLKNEQHYEYVMYQLIKPSNF